MGLVNEVIALVHEEGFLAVVVDDVEVQFAVAIDIDELGRIAPAAVLDAPLLRLLGKSAVAIVNEEEVGGAIGGPIPRIWNGRVQVVAGDIDIGKAVAVDVTDGGAVADGFVIDVGLERYVLEFERAVLFQAIAQ